MPKTTNLIGNKGATLINAFATSPLCCPSRASILTGKYQHNHRVMNNSFEGNCYGFAWQNNEEKETFAGYLEKSGYRTFYAGKYLNQYGYKKSGGVAKIPEGWSSWVGLVGNSVYYNFTLSINGSKNHFPNRYLTKVIEDYSIKFLEEQRLLKNPFLMVLTPPAPHHPFTPEPKYKGAFKGEKVPRNKQFNHANNSDKHWLLRMQPSPLPLDLISELDTMYANRLETLLSVDDLIASVLLKLRAIGKLNDTYLMITSDHGFHLGQFSMPWDKREPYEFDLRVPFLIRGPGIAPKTIVDTPILLLDIAPTILEIAGIKSVQTDGVSFLPFKKSSRTFLIEYQGEGNNSSNQDCPYHTRNLYGCTVQAHCKCQDAKNNSYSCIRSLGDGNDFKFCRYFDDEEFKEFYNMSSDPLEINNKVNLLGKDELIQLEEALQKMRKCEGQNCYCPKSEWPVGTK